MFYGAVVLLVICLTVLSLQQQLDAGQYRYRFAVLQKLGEEESEIRRLVVWSVGLLVRSAGRDRRSDRCSCCGLSAGDGSGRDPGLYRIRRICGSSGDDCIDSASGVLFCQHLGTVPADH